MSERQIVDPDGRFCGGLDVAAGAAASRNYRVVAVIGCQSGGKSTLMNAAFGTAFPVLDAPKSGRHRTTLGVWAAVAGAGPGAGAAAARAPAVVVLDVEGTDSRERGDGAKAFESRTALFTLALADVVIVNMHAHDVGRHSAANYELFETVFSHAGALRRQGRVFTDVRPVHILMVVRDHDGESAVADIRRVLMGDLENIWDALRIPDVAFEALFKVDVVALPHKVYSPKLFDEAVSGLAARFAEPVRAPQPVPMVGFEALASSIWEAVCASTGGDGETSEFTLDVPKHAALAAHFSCGEAMVKMLDGPVGARIDDLRHEVEAEWRHPLHNFGARVDAIVRDALASYDVQAAPYKSVAREACARRREELIAALADRLALVSDRYVATCRDTCMNGFEDEFRSMLGGVQGFMRESRRLAHRFVRQYKALVDGARLPPVLQPHLARKAKAAKSAQSAETGPAAATAAAAAAAAAAAGREGDAMNDDGGSDGRNDVASTAWTTGNDAVSNAISDSDGDEDDAEMYTVDRFRRDLLALVDERRRLGELLLPGGAGGANLAVPGGGPKPMPWWKGLLLRAGVMLINYLQAAHAHRRAMKVHRQSEEDFPPGPTF
jgi:hypothetical protein